MSVYESNMPQTDSQEESQCVFNFVLNNACFFPALTLKQFGNGFIVAVHYGVLMYSSITEYFYCAEVKLDDDA